MKNNFLVTILFIFISTCAFAQTWSGDAKEENDIDNVVVVVIGVQDQIERLISEGYTEITVTTTTTQNGGIPMEVPLIQSRNSAGEAVVWIWDTTETRWTWAGEVPILLP